MLHVPHYATLVRANNPGPLTLDGTNSWVLRGSSGNVVVDPGPHDGEHLQRLASYGRVVLILLTHGHHDHADSAVEFSDLVGAPIAARDPLLCRGSGPLDDAQVLAVEGLPRISVLLAPGHTMDSVCFEMEGDEPALVSGDTILGRGSTMVSHPYGSLSDYLATLQRLALRCTPFTALLPGHGPAGGSALTAVDAAIAHRAQRLDQVRQALGAGARSSEEVTRAVYGDLDGALLRAAQETVRAQLDYLESDGGRTRRSAVLHSPPSLDALAG